MPTSHMIHRLPGPRRASTAQPVQAGGPSAAPKKATVEDLTAGMKTLGICSKEDGPIAPLILVPREEWYDDHPEQAPPGYWAERFAESVRVDGGEGANAKWDDEKDTCLNKLVREIEPHNAVGWNTVATVFRNKFPQGRFKKKFALSTRFMQLRQAAEAAGTGKKAS